MQDLKKEIAILETKQNELLPPNMFVEYSDDDSTQKNEDQEEKNISTKRPEENLPFDLHLYKQLRFSKDAKNRSFNFELRKSQDFLGDLGKIERRMRLIDEKINAIEAEFGNKYEPYTKLKEFEYEKHYEQEIAELYEKLAILKQRLEKEGHFHEDSLKETSYKAEKIPASESQKPSADKITPEKQQNLF